MTEDMRYPGGKGQAGVYQWIVAKFPTHWRYVEPFAGHAGIYRHKPPAAESILIEIDPAVASKLRRCCPSARTILGCGIEYLQSHKDEFGSDDLIYLDPTYPKETRTGGRLYEHELTDQQHEQILEIILSLQCNVAISSYANDRYLTKLQDWNLDRREVSTRWGGRRVEHLWCNFESVGAIEPMYRGHDYKERWRVQKKKRRWRNRFSELPEWEQAVILKELVDEYMS